MGSRGGLSGGKMMWLGHVGLSGTRRISIILFKWVGLMHKRFLCYIGLFY